MPLLQISAAPTRELYQKVQTRLGDQPVPGRTVHVAADHPDGTVQLVDVFVDEASRAGFEQRLLAAFTELGMGAMAHAGRPPAPLPAFEVEISAGLSS
jgi:hypothetical protein